MYDRIKRTIDFAVSLLLLVAASPLFLVLAILVKIEDAGPVFYAQSRVGRYHVPFNIYKFRTMKKGSEDISASLTQEQYKEYIKEFRLENDPRATVVGSYLRNSKLDELPQLLNVLLGQMSIVGPRPILEEELGFYSSTEVEKLLSVRPGMTGYWQLNDSKTAIYENGNRQAMELYYVENKSFALDLKIFVMTIFMVIGKIFQK